MKRSRGELVVSVRVAQAEKLDVIFSAMRGLRVFQPMGFTLPKQNDEELPVGEEGHTSAPAHTRDRMGDFPAVAHWNWSQPSTDWFNLATGEALADYNPSPAMRELVAGVGIPEGNHARRPSFERVGGEIGHITLVNAIEAPASTRSATS